MTRPVPLATVRRTQRPERVEESAFASTDCHSSDVCSAANTACRRTSGRSLPVDRARPLSRRDRSRSAPAPGRFRDPTAGVEIRAAREGHPRGKNWPRSRLGRGARNSEPFWSTIYGCFSTNLRPVLRSGQARHSLANCSPARIRSPLSVEMPKPRVLLAARRGRVRQAFQTAA